MVEAKNNQVSPFGQGQGQPYMELSSAYSLQSLDHALYVSRMHGHPSKAKDQEQYCRSSVHAVTHGMIKLAVAMLSSIG